jgi:hypothetical protein
MAENITQPIVGTMTAKSIPSPTQNARKPSSLFLFNKLMMPSSILYKKAIIQQKSYNRNNCSHRKTPQKQGHES